MILSEIMGDGLESLSGFVAEFTLVEFEESTRKSDFQRLMVLCFGECRVIKQGVVLMAFVLLRSYFFPTILT